MGKNREARRLQQKTSKQSQNTENMRHASGTSKYALKKENGYSLNSPFYRSEAEKALEDFRSKPSYTPRSGAKSHSFRW